MADKPLTITPGKVTSVFVDPTLKRGDIVILAKGPSVFAGSSRFPYAKEDFVSFERFAGLDRDVKAQLRAIAQNPLQGT